MLSEQEKNNIQIVWYGLDAILKDKSESGIDTNFAIDFIQHNPWAGDTIVHLKEMLQMNFGYKPVRWVSDGDIMAYHGYYTAPNPLGEHPLLCTDVWRIENGKVQEHWDALMPLPDEQLQNAIAGAGDGEKEVSDDIRKKNKASIKRFLDHVLNRGRLVEIDSLVSTDYIYHNEMDGELRGKEVLKDHIVSKMGGRMHHDNKLLLASGDLVMAHSHYFGEKERVVFDWFRMDDGKIAEHWSVEQAIEPWENVANDHPHF
ncbi:nuclear transport factor 2 family protein [Costertonia aggregata]|uniref:Nuclear transport factor 2 family protein n=1 Tax=Costertonia aggregata TaxID=343403 RepID=A0A7H9ALW4_9FLAO|nr:nuclear transport factor 2 family protein [Costertonia aggregata]QLG44456.1 nuclear transport factor 2 family protein [Costertonia aggregata]